jgi:hypothetical protein
MADNLEDAATEVALGPSSVTVDGSSVTAQSVDEIKKAAAFIASQSAKSQPHFGLRMTQLVPGSCG